MNENEKTVLRGAALVLRRELKHAEATDAILKEANQILEPLLNLVESGDFEALPSELLK